MLDVRKIIGKFYHRDSDIYAVMLIHGGQVARKSIEVLNAMPYYVLCVDIDFVIEAAMLHDIGICKISAKFLECNGVLSYIYHGVEGRKLLDGIGLHNHAMVCERHVGVGLTSNEVLNLGIVLVARDMMPLTIEEKLICYADKFFSKNCKMSGKNVLVVLKAISKYGPINEKRFIDLHFYFTGKEI